MTNNSFNLKGVFSKSWEIFKKHFGFFIIYFLITLALNIPSSISEQMQVAARANNETYYGNPLLNFLIFVCLIISVIVSYGYTNSLIKMVYNKGVEIKDLWYTKFNIVNAFVAGLLLTPIIVLVNVVLIFIPITLFSTSILLNGFNYDVFFNDLAYYMLIFFVMTILLVLVNLVLIIRFAFVNQFIIDKDLGPINSIKASWKATKGKFFALFLFYIQIIGLNILGFLGLGVGLLITIPISSIATAYVYKQLAEDAEIEDVDEFADLDKVENSINIQEETPSTEVESKPKDEKPVVVKTTKKSVKTKSTPV